MCVCVCVCVWVSVCVLLGSWTCHTTYKWVHQKKWVHGIWPHFFYAWYGYEMAHSAHKINLRRMPHFDMFSKSVCFGLNTPFCVWSLSKDRFARAATLVTPFWRHLENMTSLPFPNMDGPPLKSKCLTWRENCVLLPVITDDHTRRLQDL